MKIFVLTLVLFIGLNVNNICAIVLRNNHVVYKEQEPYITAVTDKIAETNKNINFETDLTTENTDLVETTTGSEQNKKDETTILYLNNKQNESIKQYFHQIIIETNNERTDITPTESTTCSNEKHIHDTTTIEPQRNDLKENLGDRNKESITHEATNEILSKEITHKNTANENNLTYETTTCTDDINNSTEASPIKIQTEVTFSTKNEIKTETPISSIGKYEYIKEKLKSNLKEKLKVEKILNRLRRQAQMVSRQQTEIESNYSPDYRAPQSFNQAQYFAHNQNMYQKARPSYYKSQKVVTQNVPGNVKAVQHPPPNSGNRYPVDSYLAYSNMNNNYNLRYGTLNNGNRRQFQQNGPPRPTRRTTPRTTTRQIRKKFRPMPVFV